MTQPRSTYNKMLDREKKSVAYMVTIYCKDHHKSEISLCDECTEIKEYIFTRLTNCPFQEKKRRDEIIELFYLDKDKRELKRLVKRLDTAYQKKDKTYTDKDFDWNAKENVTVTITIIFTPNPHPASNNQRPASANGNIRQNKLH